MLNLELPNELLTVSLVTTNGELTTEQLNALIKLDNKGDTVSKEILSFFEMAETAIRTRLQFNGKDPESIYIAQDWPDLNQKIWNEIITYKTYKRMPAGFSQRNIYNTPEVRVMKPRENRTDIPDPENSGYTIDIFTQKMENIIVFTCWSLTNKEANKRALWLEDVMYEFSPYFGRNGIKVLYMGQDEDIEKVSSPSGKDVTHYGRPIHFFVETQKVYKTRNKILDTITTTVEVVDK